ncbi:MFS transporter [Vibrio scophthalmi]|uniref:MFS transporter n=1 Tax=Vibrio scophthalmi TaxID=45658 RepID=UPI00349FB0EE
MPVKQNKKFHLITIGLISTLMGLGQNGLLVSLPFLVEQSPLSLSTWSVLIAIGSFIFLPSAPYWGRYSDQYGPKKVIILALSGMAVSFSILSYFSINSSKDISVTDCFIGLLIARVLYGLTVSGLVPACQNWAINLHSDAERLQAITSVSVGLSLGRLLGPLIAIVALKISPFSPLMVMIALPCLALLAILFITNPQNSDSTTIQSKSQSWLPQKTLLPFLLSGLLLCTSIALLQYSFTPLIASIADLATGQISDAIGMLLILSAACTLITQMGALKYKIPPLIMYRIGALNLMVGFIIFLFPSVWMFAAAMAIASSGAALLVPAYTALATEKHSQNTGAVAGDISMFHTMGYGLAALLAFTATQQPLYPIYLCIVFALLILTTAYFVVHRENIM